MKGGGGIVSHQPHPVCSVSRFLMLALSPFLAKMLTYWSLRGCTARAAVENKLKTSFAPGSREEEEGFTAMYNFRLTAISAV